MLRVGIIIGVTLRMSCMCNDAIGREYYHHRGNNVLILKKKLTKIYKRNHKRPPEIYWILGMVTPSQKVLQPEPS